MTTQQQSFEINLENLDPNITVEDFLKLQCQQQIDRVKKHSEELIKQFQEESAIVREKLVARLSVPPPNSSPSV